eukprot:scaffold170276_cov36-Tisochrysis_lutea.AAC.2
MLDWCHGWHDNVLVRVQTIGRVALAIMHEFTRAAPVAQDDGYVQNLVGDIAHHPLAEDEPNMVPSTACIPMGVSVADVLVDAKQWVTHIATPRDALHQESGHIE